MDPNFVHLFLNHVPILGSIIATGVLIFGLVRKQEEIIRLSMYLFIASALLAFPVYFSGEGAEEGVEHLQGVSESLIDQHENLAKIAILLVEGLGAAAIGALVLSFKQTRLPMWYASIVCALSLINGGVMAQTAHLGGQIRHSEVRTGPGAQTQKGESGEGGESEAEEAREKGETVSGDKDDKLKSLKPGNASQAAGSVGNSQKTNPESEAKERSESGSMKSEAKERGEKGEVSETSERKESVGSNSEHEANETSEGSEANEKESEEKR